METNEKDLDLESEEPEPILGDDGEDTFDWKASDLKHYGMAKRFKTKSEKISQDFEEYKKAHPDVKPESQPQDKKEFDYAEKAYLKAMGIEKDEFLVVWEAIKSTGKSLDEILDSKYFQAELKEKREEKASQDAIPSGTKRSGGFARDSVEYWLSKGEMPPTDQRELRIKVVNAKIAAEKSKSKFTDIPIV